MEAENKKMRVSTSFLVLAFLALSIASMPSINAQVSPSEFLPPENLTPIVESPQEAGNPMAIPTEAPSALSPTNAPADASPVTLAPTTPNDCISIAPTPDFKCIQGRWTYDGNLTIGPDQEVVTLNIYGPTTILGWLNVTSFRSLALYPPFNDSNWDPKTVPLLTVSECLTRDSLPPSLSLSGTYLHLVNRTTTSTYTAWGIDTHCNSATLSSFWNTIFDDAQPVSSNSYCYSFIAQYRTFPSETDPSRFVSRIRFQWRDTCHTPPAQSPTKSPSISKGLPGWGIGLIIGGSFLTVITIFGVTTWACVKFDLMEHVFNCTMNHCSCSCCNCEGGDGSGGGGSDDRNYGSFDNNSGGGGGSFDSGGGGGGSFDSGGGGGGWTASNAGNWD